MQSKKLTKTIIDKAVYNGDGKSRCFLWDPEVKGFGLRVYPSEKKAFVLSYYIGVRKRLLTIGQFGEITLFQARELANKYLFSIRKGEDPLTARQSERKAETMAELCELYLTRHAILKNKTWKKCKSRIDRHILPAWKSRKVKSITGDDVAKLHAKIGAKAPIEANRLLQQLSKMFNLARKWGILDSFTPNPASGIDKFREKKRDRWVTKEELPRLIQSIDQEESPYVRAAFKLYLLTGVRKSELLNLKWDDVDLRQKLIRLRETKSGNDHVVPLSAAAIEILESLPRMVHNEFVLPGLAQGKSIVNLDKPWMRIRKRAALEDVRLHDLRRTMASWMVQSGTSIQVVSKLLNHQHLKTTEIYARLSNDQLFEAVGKHAESLVLLSQPRTEKGTRSNL